MIISFPDTMTYMYMYVSTCNPGQNMYIVPYIKLFSLWFVITAQVSAQDWRGQSIMGYTV